MIKAVILAALVVPAASFAQVRNFVPVTQEMLLKPESRRLAHV